jgi:hypothetical protein
MQQGRTQAVEIAQVAAVVAGLVDDFRSHHSGHFPCRHTRQFYSQVAVDNRSARILKAFSPREQLLPLQWQIATKTSGEEPMDAAELAMLVLHCYKMLWQLQATHHPERDMIVREAVAHNFGPQPWGLMFDILDPVRGMMIVEVRLVEQTSAGVFDWP